MSFKLIAIMLTASVLLVGWAGCSKEKSEEEISADEIMKGMDPTQNAPAVKTDKEKFPEPEELTAQNKNRKTDTKLKTVDKSGGLKSVSASSGTLAGLSDDGAYVVQVCVFVSSKAARRLAEKLSADGIPAYVAEVQSPVPDLSGMCYRVRVGNFRTLGAARDAGEKIASDYDLSYWADMKANDNVAKSASSSYDSYSAPATPAETYSPPPQTETPAASSSDWGTPAPSAPAPAAEPAPAPAPPPTAAPAPNPPKTGNDNFDF